MYVRVDVADSWRTLGGRRARESIQVLTQNYSYDALNRLSVAEELMNATSQWKQNYDYDRYGNRAVRNTSYIPSSRQTPTSTSSDVSGVFNQNNNTIIATSEYVYDPDRA